VAIERVELLALLQARNAWCIQGPPILYDLTVMPLDWAIRNLHTCWPGHGTFLEVAKQIGKGGAPAPDMAKLSALAAGFSGGPVLLPCFRHGTLKRVWPEEYPPNGGPADDVLIVEDGNHRMTALALRFERAQPVSVSHVGVFVARL